MYTVKTNNALFDQKTISSFTIDDSLLWFSNKLNLRWLQKNRFFFSKGTEKLRMLVLIMVVVFISLFFYKVKIKPLYSKKKNKIVFVGVQIE